MSEQVPAAPPPHPQAPRRPKEAEPHLSKAHPADRRGDCAAFRRRFGEMGFKVVKRDGKTRLIRTERIDGKRVEIDASDRKTWDQ
jgi:hypothetical protein